MEAEAEREEDILVWWSCSCTHCCQTCLWMRWIQFGVWICISGKCFRFREDAPLQKRKTYADFWWTLLMFINNYCHPERLVATHMPVNLGYVFCCVGHSGCLFLEYIFPVLPRDSTVLPGQMRYVSSLQTISSKWNIHEYLQRAAREDQMPEQPQLSSFNTKDQRLYSELHLTVRPQPVSKAEHRQPLFSHSLILPATTPASPSQVRVWL